MIYVLKRYSLERIPIFPEIGAYKNGSQFRVNRVCMPGPGQDGGRRTPGCAFPGPAVFVENGWADIGGS